MTCVRLSSLSDSRQTDRQTKGTITRRTSHCSPHLHTGARYLQSECYAAASAAYYSDNNEYNTSIDCVNQTVSY